MVIQVINQTVNTNKWQWNECQEVLKSVQLSYGITPEKPEKRLLFYELSVQLWEFLYNSILRNSASMKFFFFLYSADTVCDKYILKLLSIITQRLSSNCQ